MPALIDMHDELEPIDTSAGLCVAYTPSDDSLCVIVGDLGSICYQLDPDHDGMWHVQSIAVYRPDKDDGTHTERIERAGNEAINRCPDCGYCPCGCPPERTPEPEAGPIFLM